MTCKVDEIILKQHLQRYPYMGCKLCTHQWKCVGIINSSFTGEQVSWNLRIGKVWTYYKLAFEIEQISTILVAIVKQLERHFRESVGRMYLKLRGNVRF